MRQREVFRLTNADAAEVAGVLRDMFAPGPKLDIVSDERTNSVIIQGNVRTLQQIREVVKELDRGPVKPPVKRLRKIPLTQYTAEELGRILKEMLRKKRPR